MSKSKDTLQDYNKIFELTTIGVAANRVLLLCTLKLKPI